MDTSPQRQTPLAGKPQQTDTVMYFIYQDYHHIILTSLESCALGLPRARLEIGSDRGDSVGMDVVAPAPYALPGAYAPELWAARLKPIYGPDARDVCARACVNVCV
jgi:hypothetical protein